MANVSSISHAFNVVPAGRVPHPAPVRRAGDDSLAAARPAPADLVELSPQALRAAPALESDRVSRIRAAIESGTYETPDKIAITADLLTRELRQTPDA